MESNKKDGTVTNSSGVSHEEWLPSTECRAGDQDQGQTPQVDSDNPAQTVVQDTDACTLSLVDLPSEILLHICSFLHAKVVIRTLSRVSKLFHLLVSDNTFWKVRIKKRFPKKYPAIPVSDDEFDWKEACIEREEKYHLWSNPTATMDHFLYTSDLFAPVDAVHLMQNGSLLATGSRDRYLHLLNLDTLESGDPDSIKNIQRHVEMNAHKGWIWNINSLDNILMTGSWDTNIKFWDMRENLQYLNRVQLKSAVLCSHFEPGFLAAGGYDKKIYHIDPRTAEVISTKHYHKQPVLCLAADDKYIISGSEDKNLCIYDRRGDGVVKKLTLGSYPMALSYSEDQMWVGDRDGLLHLVDPTDGDFSIVETYNVGHKGKITGVIHTPGALFTSSTDHTVKVLEPTQDPEVITTLAQQTAEVANIDLQNNILVQANSSISVTIWKPKL